MPIPNPIRFALIYVGSLLLSIWLTFSDLDAPGGLFWFYANLGIAPCLFVIGYRLQISRSWGIILSIIPLIVGLMTCMTIISLSTRSVLTDTLLIVGGTFFISGSLLLYPALKVFIKEKSVEPTN